MESTQDKLIQGAFTQRFLIAEHIAQTLDLYNQGDYQGGQISLANLQEVKKRPYTCKILPNLTIGENLDHTAHELTTLASYNVGFILELTPRFHGLNIEKLKWLQDKLMGKVHFLYGYTPKENYILSKANLDNLTERLTQEIQFEMKHGQHKVVPSFIGELIITDVSDAYQRTLLQVCYAYQQSTLNGDKACPIFINIAKNSESLIYQLMEFFAPSQGLGVVYLLQEPIDDNLSLSAAIRDIFVQTQSQVCITLYSHEIGARFDGKGDPAAHMTDFNAFKFKYLLKDLKERGHLNRILCSTGVTFKTHLTQYGGSGYQAIFDDVFRDTLSEQDVNQIMIENAGKLLSWRPKFVAEPERPKPTWECRYCKGRFEESHQKFEKMDFNYCSMKCLGAHRQAGFK
ncbi:hypothetical protein FGO68_gene14399 [Halteria grandinella]|uniref:Vms1-associating treble clef domain-containing protein n=1 Tax=Halteria grandinella TaxID=5974 RepID=A0A8J8T5Z6_HALGN|nr:hypothetical protein FGO68_gene14399 [Halteria grandinella]